MHSVIYTITFPVHTYLKYFDHTFPPILSYFSAAKYTLDVQKERWEVNNSEWRGLSLADVLRLSKKLAVKPSVVHPRAPTISGILM